MSLISHPKEFFVKASMHAKQMKMKELNAIETDLIIADDILHRMKNDKELNLDLASYDKIETHIRRIRILIKEKKMKIMY